MNIEGFKYYFSRDLINFMAFSIAPVDPLPVGNATNYSLLALKDSSKLSWA